MLPVLRTNLKNISSRNKSLQDILKSCRYGYEVSNIEPWSTGIHNTKITLLVDQGSFFPKDQRFIERVHFYNRLDLADAINGLSYDAHSVSAAIDDLNLQGCDLTADDVDLVSETLTAKPTSLGYIGSYHSPYVEVGA